MYDGVDATLSDGGKVICSQIFTSKNNVKQECRHESIKKKKYYAGVPEPGVTQMFFTPNHVWDKVKSYYILFKCALFLRFAHL